MRQLDHPFLKVYEYMPESTSVQKLLILLLEQTRLIEQGWGDGEHSERIDRLVRSLGDCASHSSPTLNSIGLLAPKISQNMTEKHFWGIVVAIERAAKASCSDADFLILSDDLKTPAGSGHELILILDQIRSAFNVGSIFRTAECIGARKIYLCGYTATPEYTKTRRSSMGTDEHVPWQWCRRVEEAVADVKQLGYKVYGLETVERARDIVKEPLTGKVALVCGNERFGLDKETLEVCNGTVRIPVFGMKNSLNVATALAVAAYSCLDGLE